jgi:alpha-L-rhamnosidase
VLKLFVEIGKISTSWKKENDVLVLEVNIPVNTTATVILPAGKEILEGDKLISQVNDIDMVKNDGQQAQIVIGSGKYIFKVIL